MTGRRKILNLFKIGIIVFGLLQAGMVVAETYYVDQQHPAANDNNPGTTKSKPWRSLEPVNRTVLMPGDTVIVKKGVYKSQANSQLSILRPRSSGQKNKPITIKSLPSHAAILDGGLTLASAIELTGNSYVVIDGFSIRKPGKAGIVVKGTRSKPAVGISLVNNEISEVRNRYAARNTDGIRFVNAKSITITNNRINDIRDGAFTENAAGIKLYNSDHVQIANNNITNVTSGISIQSDGQHISIRKNLINNVEFGLLATNKNKTRIRYIKVLENIINHSEIAIGLSPEGGTIDKITIANNDLVNYYIAGIQTTQPGMGTTRIWNNIFDHSTGNQDFIADLITYDDPPISISHMDYNLYTNKPVIINGLFHTNRKLASLENWKRYSEYDMHSRVGPGGFKNADENDFRLKNYSIALSNGRIDGHESGRAVNIGAYQSPSIIIGYNNSKATNETRQLMAVSTDKKTKKPSGHDRKKPVKNSQQHQVKTTKSKVNRQMPEKVVVKKKKTKTTAVVLEKSTSNARTASKTGSPKKKITTSEAKQSKNKSEQKKFTIASVYPDAKPRKHEAHLKLDWDVRNALRFNGACVLESNRIYFYDGYDNASLKFRVVNDELYILTKSNIDMSFKDVGVQVGANEFLHADKVVDDQNVLIKKDLPKLLTQLRKHKMAKIQLRFWPTYPATQAYSEQVALDGLVRGYEQYKDCKRGN